MRTTSDTQRRSGRLLCLAALLICGIGRAEEAISYRLVRHEGRTVIEASDGTVVPWSSYSLAADHSPEHWIKKFPGFVEAGVNLYQVNVWPRRDQGFFGNAFWSTAGDAEAATSWGRDPDVFARLLLNLNPDARFVIRFGTQPDEAWKGKHLNEYATLDGLPSAESKRLAVNPSLASDLYIGGLDRLVRNVVRWCEAKPWRNRIVGYTLFPLGEGITERPIEGFLFDNSAPMQNAFHARARELYGTDEALQTAWGDTNVTLAAVSVPEEEAWRAKRSGLMHWPRPSETRRERDYFQLQKDLFARYLRTMFESLADATKDRPVIKGGDLIKQTMQGWVLQPEFGGTWRRDTAADYPHVLLASGSIDATPLLDMPGLDMLQTPGLYFNRAVGFAWEAEGVSDSLTLRGKVNFMEADMRTWVTKDGEGRPTPGSINVDAGTFRTPAEMRAGFDRTLAWAVSRNQMFYYMSVCGANWWYHDPLIFEHIARQREAVDALGGLAWRETRDAICLVIDEEAAQWEDFSAGFQHLAVFRQLQEGLALCGIPYRIHLLKDLGREGFPDYKVWLFPTLFRVDDATMALLEKKVFRNGNLAIFGPGTGITDGRTRSADGASRLLGVPMEVVEKTSPRRVLIGGGHPISDRLPLMTYGEDYPFGPILVPAATRFDPTNTTARALGSGWSFYWLDRPGLFINEFGKGAGGNGREGARGEEDYAVVFSTAVPLPPELLRECSRYAGCTVWSDVNAVVYGCDTFVALHTIKSGPHTLRLPRLCGVTDFYTREPVAVIDGTLTLNIEAPATRMFIME